MSYSKTHSRPQINKSEMGNPETAQTTKNGTRFHCSDANRPAEYTIHFFKLRWKAALGKASLSIVLIGVGGFLLLQITSTSDLVVQTGLLGVIGVLSGIIAAVFALPDIWGRIVVSNDSISLRPTIFGFSIPWKDLRCWDCAHADDFFAGTQQIELWKRGEDHPFLIEAAWLATTDCQQLRHTLKRRAEKCGL